MKKWIVILLLSCAGSLQAQDSLIYILDSNRQIHDLKRFTRVLRVPAGQDARAMFDKEIISQKDSNLFSSLELSKPAGDPEPYWLHVSIKAITPVSNWVLLLRDSYKPTGYTAQNDRVEVLYMRDGKQVSRQVTGIMVPRKNKAIRPNPGFNGVPFSIAAGEQLDVFIYVEREFYSTTNASYSFPVIVDPSTMGDTSVDFGNGMKLLSTVALVFFAISLFFYFFIRESAYLFFAIYTLVLSQHYLILHPEAPFIERYIPNNPQLVLGFWGLLTVGSFIPFCLFGKRFMNLKALSPQTNKWFNIFLWSWSALLLLNTATRMIWLKSLVPDPFIFVILLGMIGFMVRFAFFNSVLARLFVAGALWLFIFTGLGLLWVTDVISLPFNPWPIGQIGQMLIYAAALAYKVRLNEKLRAEANRIREMDNIKSKFFANISHEFRTPLTLIQGPLQQIEEQAQNKSEMNGTLPVPLRHLRTMRRNTDRLLELVNQLLDLSRLDAGTMTLQIIKGDAIQLLRSLAGSFDSMAERKQIHYHTHFPEQPSIVFFDKDKLEKIAANLLGNAFKYTPEQGTVALTVTLEEERLRIVVEDNGPGIPKKELDKVFDRFYQVEGTEDKGSGIGLSLVRELTELYHGQISVSSEPGKGSRFRVSLPAGRSAFKETELVFGEYKPEQHTFINTTGNSPVEEPQKSGINTNHPLLLVVEDNTELRNFIVETMQQGYQVEQAVNGKEGYEKAVALIPDIIISDVMMPLMDGFAMTEKLKQDERCSHIPVILLTAKAGQQHKITGLETGADDYLTKPFDAKELQARVDNLIRQRKLLRKKFAGSIQLKPSEVSVKSVDEVFLNNLMQTIEKNMEDDDFGVEELAKKSAMSRSQLHRKLVALIDQTPSDLLRQTRLLRAKELLRKRAYSASEVAFKVGFNSHTYFSKCFKEEFGMSPSEVAAD